MKAEQLPQSLVIPALEKQKTRDPQGEPASKKAGWEGWVGGICVWPSSWRASPHPGRG